MTEESRIYGRRFGGEEKFRQEMYKILCSKFFQRYVPEDATVLDVAAGYCEFINNIRAKKKIALDINPDAKKFAKEDVNVITSSSSDMRKIDNGSVDVVYVSNFLEHISREEIQKTMSEIHRVLRTGGTLLVLQPNIRYCYKDYWMFFDHVTPIDHRTLAEILELNGFEIIELRPRFLPYTTKNKLPKSLSMLKLYLRLPILHSLFGGQAFAFAKKRL